MSIWYEVEKTDHGFNEFLNCNWGFHDFRLERFEYVSEKDIVDIFLKYDTLNEGVLLRFVRIHDVHINTNRDYEAEWMNGSVIMRLEDDSIIWLDDDSWGDESRETILGCYRCRRKSD